MHKVSPVLVDAAGRGRLGMAVAAMVVLSAAACSASDPVPSDRYDGRYAGTRESDRADACGVAKLRGNTSASVTGGHLDMGLFNAKTRLTGTVGDDGTVRASGMWTNPTGGFPGMTVLNGTIGDHELTGTATDFRCHTAVKLRRVGPPHGMSATARP